MPDATDPTVGTPGSRSASSPTLPGRARASHTDDRTGRSPDAPAAASSQPSGADRRPDPLDDLLDDLVGATTGDRSVVLVSPHLDDAALSCPSVLAAPGGPRRVVATVFTDAGPAPWPPMGRRIARAGGHPDPTALFVDRRAEDAEVLDGLGAEHLHLGFVEAPYRRHRSALRAGRRGRPAYPTFVLDALRGRVSCADLDVRRAVRDALVEVLARESAAVALLPLGLGLHVDHLLVRDAAVEAAGVVGCTPVFYADYPYSSRTDAPPSAPVTRGLSLVDRQRTRDDVVAAAGGYRTQFDVLFPGGDVPVVPERYWLPAPARAASPE